MALISPFYIKMSTTKTNSEHPTNEPFTSPDEPSHVNNCGCGIFLLPLAAIGGLIDQIQRKMSRLFSSK